MSEAAAIARDIGKPSQVWRATVAAIAAASAIVLTGCGDGHDVTSGQLATTHRGHIEDIAWLPDGELYVLRRLDSAGPSELALITADGGTRATILQSTAFCGTPEVVDISSLPDGRLGAVVDCASTPSRDRSRMAVAINDGKLVELASLDGSQWLLSWNADLISGWVEYLTGHCRSVARFVNGRVAPFPKHDPAHLVSFDLDRDFFGPPGCSTAGRAGFLTVGRSGEIFFLVSDDAESVLDERALWRVVAFNPKSGLIRDIGSNFSNPYDLAVTPSETSLLVSGRHNNKMGVWRINAANGKVSLALSGRFGAISMNADGRRAAVGRSTSKGDDVVQLDLVS